MTEAAAYRSFLLRLWLENETANPSSPAGWQAEVESIQSGESWSFSDLSSLLDFIEAKVLPPDEEQ
jgi:hypothetical protein